MALTCFSVRGLPMAAGLVGVLSALFDPYRPELHYMRGPGPKWREKHGDPQLQGRWEGILDLCTSNNNPVGSTRTGTFC
jgi:hypothetical protein